MVGRPCSSLSSAGGISLRLKHVEIDSKQVSQDAREVKTKFSKTSIVDCFPIGDDIEGIVIDWITELKAMRAGGDAPFSTTPFKPWIGRHSIELEFLPRLLPCARSCGRRPLPQVFPTSSHMRSAPQSLSPVMNGPLLCGI